MSWNTINIESWDKFLEFVESTKVHESSMPEWIFRGQTDKEWTLAPSLLRKFKLHEIDRKSAVGIEKQIFREFLTKERLYCNHDIPKSEHFFSMNVFAMMQHYSCPTRLLDWTNSPFIALYFAVESKFETDGALFTFK